MIGSRASIDVASALAALARTAGSLGAGAPIEQALAELIRAAAQGTGAELAVLWLPEPGGALVARAVWCSSAGLAAELEGLRVEAGEHPAAVVRSRLDEGAEGLTVPFEAVGGDGVLELARRGPAFEQEETQLATLAAELAALAGRLENDAARKNGHGTLDVAGDALAAVAADDGAPARVARLAAVASGGDAAPRLAAPRRRDSSLRARTGRSSPTRSSLELRMPSSRSRAWSPSRRALRLTS